MLKEFDEEMSLIHALLFGAIVLLVLNDEEAEKASDSLIGLAYDKISEKGLMIDLENMESSKWVEQNE